MVFGRSEKVYTDNGEDIMTYSCSIKYMTMQLKEFYPNITEDDVKLIVTDQLSVLDSFVLGGIADQYKEMKGE